MPNHLLSEKSPYLLQHANNPVDWHPWGNAAFEQARREDKPIFLSIGYSTCHWCHVMERESFEDEAVARLLNADWPVEGGGTMKISAACADTGGNWTQSCYSQIRRLRDPRIKAIKGVPGWNRAAPVNGPTLIDITENGRKIRRGRKFLCFNARRSTQDARIAQR